MPSDVRMWWDDGFVQQQQTKSNRQWTLCLVRNYYYYAIYMATSNITKIPLDTSFNTPFLTFEWLKMVKITFLGFKKSQKPCSAYNRRILWSKYCKQHPPPHYNSDLKYDHKGNFRRIIDKSFPHLWIAKYSQQHLIGIEEEPKNMFSIKEKYFMIQAPERKESQAYVTVDFPYNYLLLRPTALPTGYMWHQIGTRPISSLWSLSIQRCA